MDDLAILCACDDSYAPYCGTMLTSLFCNNKRHKIVVYILSSSISDENRARFLLLAQRFGQRIELLPVNASDFLSLPIGQRFSNISVEAYFRLKVSSLLPQCDRVLYLDCDMIVRHDLQPLWDTDVEGYAMASVMDSTLTYHKCFPRLGYDPRLGYFNSGMGLYNLQFMRQFDFETKVVDFIANHYDKILFHDQDIINCVCCGHIKAVSPTWNLLEVFLRKRPPIVPQWHDQLMQCRMRPAIVHYASLRKPWFKECAHPYRDEFWKYVALSPWHDMKPRYKYSGLKRWSSYYLKVFFKALGAPFGFGRYDKNLKLAD